MKTSAELTITICSFGYHRSGLPHTSSEHGGGYVFDCRALPNPGREPEFADKTGLDQPVIDYLDSQPSVSNFLNTVYVLVNQHACNFLERGFTSLSICFGCTGGQHRSVYCAEKIAERLIADGFKTRIVHMDKPQQPTG